MEQRDIYIVFSATPYRVGKIIRKVTKETYNHVSIALDAELLQMYGFARRYFHTPFYGGFVHESLSRFHINGEDTQVSICKLSVTEAQYNQVAALLQQMYADADTYIYNHFSILSSCLRKPLRIKNAYTCVEFCVHILHTLGFDTDPVKYYTVGDLEQLLRSYMVYTGDMYPSKDRDEIYYAKRPVSFPVLTTLRDIAKLFPRMFQK